MPVVQYPSVVISVYFFYSPNFVKMTYFSLFPLDILYIVNFVYSVLNVFDHLDNHVDALN